MGERSTGKDTDRAPKVVECAGVALINRGRIFLIRPLFKGLVQQPGIPKGHVESGESPQSAARREFFEETGIDLTGKPLELLCYVYSKIDGDTDKKVIVYRVDGDGTEYFRGSNLAENGEPENVDGGYVGYGRALEEITPYQQPIIKRLIEQESVSSFSRFIKSSNWS